MPDSHASVANDLLVQAGVMQPLDVTRDELLRTAQIHATLDVADAIREATRLAESKAKEFAESMPFMRRRRPAG